jgi:amino acid adenylation domain-containing protein
MQHPPSTFGQESTPSQELDNSLTRAGTENCCAHELFEEQVLRRAESVALLNEDDSLTYQELNHRANQLARYLRKRGVGPEVLVGVCMERSLDVMVALFAIMKAGGAYVPLDPAHPRERIASILSDARCRLLITQRGVLEGHHEIDVEPLLLDASWPAIAKEAGTNLECLARPHNLAYVIYTSGSTGKPKGVQVEHHSVVNLVLAMQEETGINETDVVAAVTTFSFDMAGVEIHLPLASGARTAMFKRSDAVDGKKLQARMSRAGVTLMQGTPATWRLLLETGWPGDKNLKIVCGGEAVPRDLANQLVSRCRLLWNMYGPTETTVWSSVYQVTGPGEGGVPVGHAIRNTYFHIVDDQMKPVPAGTEGQLLIGGDGVARGYFNRRELTQEKFIPDPFSAEPGARLYKTGDLARFLPDGNLDFLGRLDHQVKIRGFRIELGEIEFNLTIHPSIKQCVVAAREDSPGDKRLVAYVVAEDGQKPVSRVLREFLQTKLPSYMVPSVFVVVKTIPLTPNGKVDRKALPAPSRNNSALDYEYVVARTSLERELVDIWESVLGIKPIGIRDNIFELGVDSVTAAQLFARIEKTLGKDLPPAPLFHAPTIELLADLLQREDAGLRRWTSLVAIQPRGDKTPLFCAHGGAGTVLLFHPLANRLAPDRPVYAFQARGLYGRDLPHTSVEEMAAHYIREMRTVQPRGPYLLSGWCFGGFVVFEMAQQLVRMGEQVEMLAMLNAASGPEYEARASTPEPGSIADRVSSRWVEFRHLPARERISYAQRKLKGHILWRAKHFYRRIALSAYRSTITLRLRVYSFYAKRGIPLPDSMRNKYFVFAHSRMERRYQFRPYPGNIVVLHDQLPYRDPELGWGRFAREVDVVEIPVSIKHHRAIMREPFVSAVAETIERYLSRETGPRAAGESIMEARLRSSAS